MKLEVVNENNINEAINRLKNKSSYGHDEISNKIVKSAKNALIQPLTLVRPIICYCSAAVNQLSGEIFLEL